MRLWSSQSLYIVLIFASVIVMNATGVGNKGFMTPLNKRLDSMGSSKTQKESIKSLENLNNKKLPSHRFGLNSHVILCGSLLGLLSAGTSWGIAQLCEQSSVVPMLVIGCATASAYYIIQVVQKCAYEFLWRSIDGLNAKIFNPGLCKMIQETANKSEIDQFQNIKIIMSNEMNAFIFGNTNIAMTSGLVNRLSVKELRAVIAHECAHVKNGDTSTGWFFFVVQASIAFIINWGNELKLKAMSIIDMRNEGESTTSRTPTCDPSNFKGFMEKTGYDLLAPKKKVDQITLGTFNLKSDSDLVRAVGFGSVVETTASTIGALTMFLNYDSKRRNEFNADAAAAKLCGRPAMISALKKIAG